MKRVLSRLEAFRIALKADHDWQMDNVNCVKAGQSNMCVLPIAMDEVTLQNYHTIAKYMEYFRNAICSHWRKREYTFYSWVDEMGGRICMSIVPEDCKPPFGASEEWSIRAVLMQAGWLTLLQWRCTNKKPDRMARFYCRGSDDTQLIL